MRPEGYDRVIQADVTSRPASRRRALARAVLALALSWLALGATPAKADDNARYVDVACGSALTLKTASGVPRGATHLYDFSGVCSLRVIYDSGPYLLEHVPVDASARWDAGSQTYTESLHALAAMSGEYENPAPGTETFTGAVPWKVGTGPEVATFRCDTDPVLTRSAQCTLVTSRNGTGFGGGRDGFAHLAAANRPMLLGLASAAQATRLSRSKAFPPISCAGLQLTEATGVSYGKGHSYRFGGTCLLYQTEFGDQGRQVTRVSAEGKWNAGAYQATQSVTVLAAAAKGGGTWNVRYTCSGDPWLKRQAQCSRTSRSGPQLSVYDPVTDLFANRPLGAPVGYAKAKRLSEQNAPKRFVGPRSALAMGSRLPSLPPRLVIESAQAVVMHRCALRDLIDIRVTLLNEGGPLADHTRNAYVRAAEFKGAAFKLNNDSLGQIGGAALDSEYDELPQILPGQTWQETLRVGTDTEHLSKLPGRHSLIVFTGPANAPASSVPYVEAQPTRITVTLPAGYCQPRVAVPTMMHAATSRAPAVHGPKERAASPIYRMRVLGR